MTSEIVLTHTFDAGHRIVGHKGKCARLHGHTYKAEISMIGEVVDPGFVVDFGDVKDLLNKWDHKLLLWEHDPTIIGQALPVTDEGVPGPSLPGWLEDSEAKIGVVRLTFNPTAENMANYLAKEVGRTFGLIEVELKLWETPKAYARAYWHSSEDR